jgi:hypothetical protein
LQNVMKMIWWLELFLAIAVSVKVWNAQPIDFQDTEAFNIFKRYLKVWPSILKNIFGNNTGVHFELHITSPAQILDRLIAAPSSIRNSRTSSGASGLAVHSWNK